MSSTPVSSNSSAVLRAAWVQGHSAEVPQKTDAKSSNRVVCYCQVCRTDTVHVVTPPSPTTWYARLRWELTSFMQYLFDPPGCQSCQEREELDQIF